MLSRISHGLGNFIAGEEGAAMVEFTIMFPVLIVMALGAAEIGRAVQHHHAVEKSARDAARYLARVQASCAGITDAGDVATAKNLARTGYRNGTTPILPYWQDANTTITVTVDCFANDTGTILNRANAPFGSSIPLITVSIEVPYEDIGFLGLLGITGFSMTGSHSEVSIGE